MPRPKKDDSAVAAAQQAAAHRQLAPLAAVPQGPPVIDIQNFIRVRDSVYARLTTIQDLIKAFSADYLRQTNLLIGEPTPAENGVPLTAPLAAPAFGGFQQLDPFQGVVAAAPEAAAAAAAPADGEKKERKKRQHDPNAPKRPLTPYFLYMQSARPIIAKDLGEDAAKGAVQTEGQRRWASMDDKEKSGWFLAYRHNLRYYNARVHAYKAGNELARDMDDVEANAYAEKHNIPVPSAKDAEKDGRGPASGDDALIAEQLAAEPSAAAAPAETPKKKARAGRKSAAAKEDETVVSTSQTPATDKKRKRGSKNAPAEEKAEEQPKKAGRGKKAKTS